MKTFAFLASSLVVCSVVLLRADAQEPPSRFSHQYHIEEEELVCSDCHTRALSSTQSADNLNPGREVCLDCHDPDQVPQSWSAPEREYQFSHQVHFQTTDLKCTDCHAGVEKMERTTPEVRSAMASCVACHSELAANRDCATCHTQLVPPTHQAGWKREHGHIARISDTSCRPCHAVGDCQECHEGATLIELTELAPGQHELAGTRQTPFGPELEGTQGMLLKRHSLNYRFTHALEARGKVSDCATCHEFDTGDFCVECHDQGANPDIRPAWHGGPDWGALAGAVGSGGGRHAELARRDMETCMVCHDLQGEDPTCLLCHMDRTRGPGNDPQTHSASFSGDIGEGDFHGDDGAMCFTCHLYKGPTGGDGFCGYCHGRK